MAPIVPESGCRPVQGQTVKKVCVKEAGALSGHPEREGGSGERQGEEQGSVIAGSLHLLQTRCLCAGEDVKIV